MTAFVLASASPARLATLRSAGLDPEVVVSGVDESQLDGLPPAELALQLAELKAAPSPAGGPAGGALVLGCDSVLELDGEVLGKPEDADEAVRRWQQMRGRSGVLHTGHCVLDTATGEVAAATAATTVRFADVDDEEIAAYVATGEPLWVAGAFTVDGLGGAFVRGIEGDHHNVVGVSLPLLRELVAELGHTWTELWAPAVLTPASATRRLVRVLGLVLELVAAVLVQVRQRRGRAEDRRPGTGRSARPGRGTARRRSPTGCPRSGRRARARCG